MTGVKRERRIDDTLCHSLTRPCSTESERETREQKEHEVWMEQKGKCVKERVVRNERKATEGVRARKKGEMVDRRGEKVSGDSCFLSLFGSRYRWKPQSITTSSCSTETVISLFPKSLSPFFWSSFFHLISTKYMRKNFKIVKIQWFQHCVLASWYVIFNGWEVWTVRRSVWHLDSRSLSHAAAICL